MFRFQVHGHIERITEVLYRVGFWHRKDQETVAEWRLKIFYSIFYGFYPLSLMAGAFASDDKNEFVLLVEASLMTTVLLAKLLYLIWRKREILEQLNRICDYGVEDIDTFNQIKNKLNMLMKFAIVFLSLCCLCGICIVLVVPFLSNERRLFFNIGFPLDYKNNEFAYWAAFVFIFTETIIIVISVFCSVIIWYLMAKTGMRYIVLGQQIKVMGEIRDVNETSIEIKISNAQRDNLYQQDLIEAIKSYQHLEELTNQLGSFLSKLFAVQLTTSGLCICTSVYSLAFNRSDNLFELTIYLIFLLNNIFDIFMVMYFGNEIQLATDRLSYCLFESNWVDRSQIIKKNVLIFGEFLKKPHQLVALKLYPLNLVTFMRILNSAYSMFNILQNLK